MKKFIIAFLFINNLGFSQNIDSNVYLHFDEFFKDAIFFSNKFITPATDAAVYQAASGWIYSIKEKEQWSTSFGVHANVFFVPSADRSFELKNSDFTFLKLQNGTSANVATALGGDEQVRIVDVYGVIKQTQPIKTPKGVNQNEIFYPHLSGSVCVGYGTEVLAKFAPKTAIKQGEYQVYGFGLMHNVSRYSDFFKSNNLNLAFSINNSIENISFDFLDIESNLGTLGISRINGNINSWQFQTYVSKEFGHFELMFASLVNVSDFKYEFSGEKGTIDNVIKFEGGSSQAYFNKSLESIYKTKMNSMFEVSATYNYRNFYLQSAFAFSKFLNSNISIHYKIN